MSWLTIKLAFKKFLVWLKEYWQVPFLILWTAVVWVFARRNTEAMVEAIQAKKESHKKQIEVLNKSHKEEIQKKNELIEKYHETLDKLEEEFRNKKTEVSDKHKREVRKIIETSKGDPDEIKKKIQQEFGFTLVE